MRWTQLLAADPGSLLRGSNQILTAFIDFTRTYCSPIMVNLKCPSVYGRIDPMREHNIVCRWSCCERQRVKYFGRRTGLLHPVGISTLFCLAGFDIFILSYYISLHCMSMSSDMYSGRYPNKTILSLAYQRLPFPFSQRPPLQSYVVGQISATLVNVIRAGKNGWAMRRI
jgi:hypothetical protein